VLQWWIERGEVVSAAVVSENTAATVVVVVVVVAAVVGRWVNGSAGKPHAWSFAELRCQHNDGRVLAC